MRIGVRDLLVVLVVVAVLGALIGGRKPAESEATPSPVPVVVTATPVVVVPAPGAVKPKTLARKRKPVAPPVYYPPPPTSKPYEPFRAPKPGSYEERLIIR